MQYLFTRRWFYLCILLAIGSFSVKGIAENNATKGAMTIARASQDVADGKQTGIPDVIEREALTYASRADNLRFASFWLLAVGLVFFGLSMLTREPVNQDIAMLFLIVACVFQLLIV